MLHFFINRIVIVLAIILFAGIPKMMLIAKLAIADPRVKSFLLLSTRLPHLTVDTLSTAIDWYTVRIAWRCILVCHLGNA